MKALSLILCGVLLTTFPVLVSAQDSLYLFSGDGITVKVLTEDEDSGAVTGEITIYSDNGATYPFEGVVDDDDTISGKIHIRGQDQAMRGRVNGQSLVLEFSGRTYQLSQGSGVASIIPPFPVPDMNQGQQGNQATPPTPDDGDPPPDMTPVPNPNPNPDSNPNPDPNPNFTPNPNPDRAPGPAPDTLRLKREYLHDVAMGGVISHHLLIPSDWNLEGQVQWSNDKTPIWQYNFKITGPEGEKVSLIPTWVFSYLQAKNSNLPTQGIPPPQNLAAWLVEYIRQNNHEIQNVQLINSQWDSMAEQAWNDNARAVGMVQQGPPLEFHQIDLSYLKDGVLMHEEISISYARLTPIDNINIYSQTWMLFINRIIAAPEATFAQKKPLLLSILGNVKMVPKWWNQMMQVRSAIIQKNFEEGMAEIRRRARMYEEMSDAQFAAWKRYSDSQDEIQRKRIQMINEVEDFRDVDGSRVELTIHHKYVFSDGQGNYILTNDYNNRPGGNYQEIHPE